MMLLLTRTIMRPMVLSISTTGATGTAGGIMATGSMVAETTGMAAAVANDTPSLRLRLRAR